MGAAGKEKKKKVKKLNTQHSNSTLWYLNIYMYTHVQSSTTHRSQKVEAVQITTDGQWINKLWHIHVVEVDY